MTSSISTYPLRSAAGGNARSRRLFIVEFDLAELSSHFFNQVLGFKLAAAELGLEPCVLVGEGADAQLTALLAARRVINFKPRMIGSPDYDLDCFADGDSQLRSLWSTIEALDVSSDDIVLVTSGRPIVIYSLGAWLGRLDRRSRPAVFFRFFGGDYYDPTTRTFSQHSWMQRFAARDLSLRSGEDRVFFTANNSKLIEPLSRLCMRRVFQMPIPKFYGDIQTSGHGDAGSPVIYTHMNMRCGIMLAEIESLIRTVLDSSPDVRFILKYGRYALDGGAAAVLSPDLLSRGVELIPAEQPHLDYLRIIASSDIILLPYEVEKYTSLASGVFAEGAAYGKVMVYPGKSWMEDQVAGGHAAGVSFGATNQSEISAAVLQAIGSLPELSKRRRSDRKASARKTVAGGTSS